jgi:hypothetical protein
MSKHVLGRGASVEVLAIDRVFHGAPTSITSDGKHLAFGDRDATNPSASITFRFKASGTSEAHRFGIKQLCLHESHSSVYAGNKQFDGCILEGTTTLNRGLFLDLSTSSLNVLFEPGTAVSTGARATAPHAPFFAATASAVRAGAPVALGIIDSPGGNHPLERRNVATDRLNFLVTSAAAARFLTVLVAVVPGSTPGQSLHVPLIGARWRWEADARIAYDPLGKASIGSSDHRSTPIESTTDFTDREIVLLTDPALTAADCISQKFNDAMYRTVGLHQRQDFSKKTLARTDVGSGGYTIEQYPDWRGLPP